MKPVDSLTVRRDGKERWLERWQDDLTALPRDMYVDILSEARPSNFMYPERLRPASASSHLQRWVREDTVMARSCSEVEWRPKTNLGWVACH